MWMLRPTRLWPLIAAWAMLFAFLPGCGGSGGASPPPGGGFVGWLIYSSIDAAGINPKLMRVNLDGTGTVELPTSPGAEHPAISPDGSRIAYIELVAGFYRLRVMNLDGTENTVIREGAFDNLEPSFSPDGRSLLFTSTEFGTPQVFHYSFDTSITVQLTHGLDGASQARFSPDGATIVFASGLDIALMNADGSQVRPLVADPETDHSPTFSPDGTRIAFIRDVEIDVMQVGQVHVVPAAGGAVTRLSLSGLDEQNPEFNHDGSRLIFARATGTGSEIFLMPATGGTATQVSSDGAFAAWPTVPWRITRSF